MAVRNEVIEKLADHLKLTISQLAASIGKPAANLYDIQSGKIKGVSQKLADTIVKNYPEISRTWLLTGEGSMLAQPSQGEAKAKVEQNEDYRLVPLINIDSVGGMHSPNAITDEPQYVETLIPFVGAYEGDICIQESGNSMSPSIPAGSVLLIRNVPNWAEYFGYGGVYVIELNDGRRITKEIRRSEVDPSSRVLCHSFNETVADEELPKSLIVSVWKVIKVLTNFGY